MRCRCGSTDIEHDASRGSAVCKVCGQVLEENTIISEVTFADSGSGQSSVVGKFVRATGSRAVSGGLAGFGKESRDITISNGRAKIRELATGLHLNQHHEDFAVRLFTLAVQHNFVQGRKTENVCSACLYIVCRREKTPHLLIDFSDLLQTNVFPLGQTFLKLVRLLNITVPLIDPSLYIHRFASKLEFEEQTHGVAMTAVRLVGRMSRDWLQTGRRPAGICGACLLIAARMHGFRRAQQDILKVVHVCDSTLRNRLEEFVKTPASALTQGEFESESLDDLQSENPPAYQRAETTRKEDAIVLMIENGMEPDAAVKAIEDKAALDKGAQDAAGPTEQMTEQLERLENNSNTRGTKRRAPPSSSQRGGRPTRSATPSTTDVASSQGSTELAIITTAPQLPDEIDLKPFLKSASEVRTAINAKLDEVQLGLLCRQMQVAISGRKQTRKERAKALAQSHPNIARWAYARLLAKAPAPHPAIWRALDKQNERPDLTASGTVQAGGDQGQPSATAVAMAKAQARNGETGRGSSAASTSAAGESDDDHLSDVDDDIDAYLIKDSKEVKAKEDIWMTMNAEFLEAQEDKARRDREDEAMGRTTSSASRKRRRQNGGADGHGSAAEATLQALQEKRVSSKDAASGGSAPATVASTKSAPAANSVAQKQSSRAASESAAATAGDSEEYDEDSEEDEPPKLSAPKAAAGDLEEDEDEDEDEDNWE